MTAFPAFQHLALDDLLEQGYTLPAKWYTDNGVLREEKRKIFARTWQYAGHMDLAKEPGEFFTVRLGDVPILVVRDRDRQLRGFINVCRHRGSELVLEPCGRKQLIQCHYHAWTYNLDGTLRSAPGSKLEPDFDLADFPLRPVQIDNWGPFIFVNPDLAAGPLSDVLGELPAMVTAAGLDMDSLHVRIRGTMDMAANWKITVDNYLECYHCPTAHPAFSDIIDVDTYTVTPYEYFSVQSGGVKESARRSDRTRYAIGGGVDEGLYAFIWPNFTFGVYPGPGNISINVFVPVDADHTVNVFEYAFADSIPDEEAQQFTSFIDQVKREDVGLCESVQRGLHSGYFDQGKLLLSRENGLRHFQTLVYRALTQ